MIRSPRRTDSEALRYRDCEAAIGPVVDTILHACRAPFFDFHSLLHAILPEAKSVGWTEDEIQSALRRVTRDFRIDSRKG